MTLIHLEEKTSPMMQQWHACKKQADSALLLFRLGDFYEAFYEDAITLAKELDLTLTKRQEIPMAGIPFHTSEGYVDKLIAKGYRVAIAEQMEDPKQTKGIVKREIVRIVTPGTVVTSSLISDKTNNFVASLCWFNHLFGLAILDLTTADFRVFEFDKFAELQDEVTRLEPKELIVSQRCHDIHAIQIQEWKKTLRCTVQIQEEWHFDPRHTYDVLIRHFHVHSLDGFGLKGMSAGIHAAGRLLSYVQDELNLSVSHIRSLRKESSGLYMSLDSATLKHLEIFESLQEKQSSHTLLHLIDKTVTPMGARLLRHWLLHPLLDIEEIAKRQEAVEWLIENPSDLRKDLSEIRDLERLIMKIETGYANPKDLRALALSLRQAPLVLAHLHQTSSSYLSSFLQLQGTSGIADKVLQALVEDPPFRISDGSLFRDGYHQELDELRKISSDSHEWIASYQMTLREQTQIKTLKVGFTKAFGYYIEVSRGQSNKMPETFQKRQTLVNTERYISPELSEYEHKVLSAADRLLAIETELFHQLREEIAAYAPAIRDTASSMAHIDALSSFAKVAKDHRYVKPQMNQTLALHIEAGRHPVIEASGHADTFIPNDLHMDTSERLWILTGPNMAGKSTFIRQTALIAILAQIGSFVPAKKVEMGIIDKVFTRIGASDNLSRGQSTFMVEMAETANILHHATDRSLVILDEIGRGTSTYDGISIAWAVAEYLLTTPGKKAKTLFATHYCELIRLAEEIPGAINYHISVHESDQGIVFLRKIARGGTDKSYGIHVGRLAGLPSTVLERAEKMLLALEKESGRKKTKKQDLQLSFLPESPPIDHWITKELKAFHTNQLTPMAALFKLAEWKNRL